MYSLYTVCIGFFLVLRAVVSLDIGYISQYPDYPSGCESVASVMVLQYQGYDIDVDMFIDCYLDKISVTDARRYKKDPFNKYFVGDPRSDYGWCCNPPVIVRAIKEYFSEINSNSSVVNLTGIKFRDLLYEVEAGNPVIVWVTRDYVEPDWAKLGNGKYVMPSHTVVLSGYDMLANEVTFVDSISGVVRVPYNQAENIYSKCGNKAVVVRKE